MEYALVDGARRGASPGAQGICEICQEKVIAKCGPFKRHHWAHVSRKNCDDWYEPETLWHRNWKSHFPPQFQEVVVNGKYGKSHRADVKVASGLVIEFQHSYLSQEEIHERSKFYGDMIWVIDGCRRKRDQEQFGKILQHSNLTNHCPACYALKEGRSALLRDWRPCGKRVIFDFGLDILWCLLPRSHWGMPLIMPAFRKAGLGFLAGDHGLHGLDLSQRTTHWHHVLTRSLVGEPRRRRWSGRRRAAYRADEWFWS